MAKIRVLGPRDRPSPDGLVINTTSRSSNWSRGLSPFFLGPVVLYEGAGISEAKNVENAWQFAKVYRQHLDDEGNPSEKYFQWAHEGWSNSHAFRYPMDKGAVPEYSWWEGEKLSYLEARKRIYLPLYTRAVVRTPAFQKLLEIARGPQEVWLWDFDGYDHVSLGMTLKEVLDDPRRKMGHAFVLAMILEKLAPSM